VAPVLACGSLRVHIAARGISTNGDARGSARTTNLQEHFRQSHPELTPSLTHLYASLRSLMARKRAQPILVWVYFTIGQLQKIFSSVVNFVPPTGCREPVGLYRVRSGTSDQIRVRQALAPGLDHAAALSPFIRGEEVKESVIYGDA
jgi:hypothetical protein